MQKAILLTLAIVLCAPVLAQKNVESKQPKCSLKLDQSPELRGFRLGMPQDQVLRRLPGVTIEKPDKYGLARLRLSIIDTSTVIKTSGRDKAVQPDITATPADGSAFVLDGPKFPDLKGVRKLQMRFIDGRLSYLQISYDDSSKWESIDQFVETIAGKLKLPTQWQAPSDAEGESQEKELRCEAFVISASLTGDPTDTHAGPEILLEDLAAWNAMSKRQNDSVEKAKQEADEKRKAFKP
jgi:hypothetical protein